MDSTLMLGLIIIVFIYIILILFMALIPIFSLILYRRISKKMSSTEKSLFGGIVILINVFIVTGAYFFIFKNMFE